MLPKSLDHEGSLPRLESSDHLSVNQSWASRRTLFVLQDLVGIPHDRRSVMAFLLKILHSFLCLRLTLAPESQGQMFFRQRRLHAVYGSQQCEGAAAADCSLHLTAAVSAIHMYTVNKSLNLWKSR